MNVISPDDLGRGLMDQNKAENNALLSGILPAYKQWGKTPLQTLKSLRQEFPVLEKATLSYAGRLDPLAEGLMLVLVGEANKQREQYLGLDKTYEVEVVFGIKTDTGDLLGVPTMTPNEDSVDFADELALKFKSRHAEDVLGELVGNQVFPYPIYSSKTVKGKPLHEWAKEGRISEIEIPKTDVVIYSLEKIDTEESSEYVTGFEIIQKLDSALDIVSGDFRFNEIRNAWHKILDGEPGLKFPALKIRCSCSSGTYMRTLAEETGKKYGLFAIAYSIKRIKVGEICL